MDKVDRYVYAVVSLVPRENREDIERELRALINEMIKKYPLEESESSKVEKVLLELGDPEALAEKYIPEKRYLIGPKYFRKYIFVLKIVLGAVFIGLTISMGLESAFSFEKGFGSIISNYMSTLISGLAQGFVWVTVVFAIIEYKKVDLNDEEPKKKWNLKDLNRIAVDKSAIPVSSAIFGMIFSAIFILLLYFSPEIFAAYVPGQGGGLDRIPLFNIEALSQYNVFILGIFLAGAAKEIVKLVYRRWTIQSSILYCLFNIALMILTIVVFFNLKVWNPNFLTELIKDLNLEAGGGLNPVQLWRQITSGIIVLFLAGNIIDMASTLYKAVKYNFTASM